MFADGAVTQPVKNAWRFLAARWVACLLVLHAVKMLFWFHAVGVGSGFPLINVDYVEFYGRALRIHEFLARSGRIWGYDPFDMGGYLSGPFLEVGVQLLALLAHALEPALPISTTLLLCELTGLAGAPFLLVWAARLFGADRRQSWAAFGLTVFFLGGVETFSTGMYKLGLWGWMLSCSLGLVMIGLLWRWLNEPTAKGWTLFTAIAALGCGVHPSLFIDVLGAATLAYAIAFRRLSWRGHLALAGAALAVLALNWFWISPFIAFPAWRTTAPYYDTGGFRDLFWRFGPFQKDFYTSVRAILHGLVMWQAIHGLRRIRARTPAVATLLGGWLAWLALIAYFGSWLPWVRTLQPGRNEFPLWLLAYVLAGFSLEDALLRDARSRRIAAVLGAFCLVYVFELAPGASPWSKFAAPLTNRLPAWQTNLIRYLAENKPADGRVMLECNDDLQPHFADIVPPLTGAILIGGQHPGNFLATRSTLFSGVYVSFQDDRSQDPIAFNHRLADMGEDLFLRYLALYNVRLVVARQPQTVDLLTGFGRALAPAAEIAPFHAFRVLQPAGWFVQGDGRVTFDYDRILIERATPGRLILKAHWLSTLRADPEAPLSPVYEMDDPVPFISIDNSAGHKRIEIYNAGLPPLTDRLRGRFRDDWGHR